MKKHLWLSLLLIFPIILAGQTVKKALERPEAKEVIQEIITHTNTPVLDKTVDVIVAGNPETRIKGIVSCMFATMEVLEKAVAIDANLIVTHEPTFYNHLDKADSFLKDPVYKEKIDYIEKNELVVWRFHDYAHRTKNDLVLTGMVKKLGWEKNQLKPGIGTFGFKTTTLNNILSRLKDVFPENSFYVVGKAEMPVSRVALAPGAPGSMRQINLLRDPDIDVVIGGEVPQWETYEYVRDAVFQNKNKAIVFIGHSNSEESGMKNAAEWMQEFLVDIPVTFIPSGPAYWSYE